MVGNVYAGPGCAECGAPTKHVLAASYARLCTGCQIIADERADDEEPGCGHPSFDRDGACDDCGAPSCGWCGGSKLDAAGRDVCKHCNGDGIER